MRSAGMVAFTLSGVWPITKTASPAYLPSSMVKVYVAERRIGESFSAFRLEAVALPVVVPAGTVVLGAKSAVPTGRIVPLKLPVMWPPRIAAEETVPSVVFSAEMLMKDDCVDMKEGLGISLSKPTAQQYEANSRADSWSR